MANYENPETFRITAEAYNQHIEEQYHEENDNGLSTPRVKNLGARIIDALRKFLHRSEP